MKLAYLYDFLQERAGAAPAVLVTNTVPKMRKTGNPFWGQVRKLARRQGFVGTNYENAVNRQRVREGQPMTKKGAVLGFKALPMSWGQSDGPKFVEYDGKSYLRFQHIRTLEEEFRSLGGAVIPKAALEPFLVHSGGSQRQETDKPIIWNTITLSNIVLAMVGGKVFHQ